MKRTILNSTAALVILTLSLTNCTNDQAIEALGPAKTKTDVLAVPFFVETDESQLPGAGAEVLYEARLHMPVIAPNGTHVTWEQFSAVKGRIDVACMSNGTEITLDMTGLIPNGVYTIWNVTVKAPGFDPMEADMNVTGIGAAGQGDGSDNKFTADTHGRASITMTSPGGDLSMFGDIEPCALTSEYEWHVVGAYHIDGNTYGPSLGPDGTVTEQFAFIFRADDD